MRVYIGTKLVFAEPLSREGVEGFRVVYPGGHESWSPYGSFTDAYKPLRDMAGGNAEETINGMVHVQPPNDVLDQVHAYGLKQAAALRQRDVGCETMESIPERLAKALGGEKANAAKPAYDYETEMRRFRAMDQALAHSIGRELTLGEIIANAAAIEEYARNGTSCQQRSEAKHPQQAR